MTETLHTRRDTLILAAGATALLATTQAGAAPALTGHEHDWDWLEGSWKVRHHVLKGRLVGATEWEDFNGTCSMVRTMGGLGNMDDNLLERPSGSYRAMGVRAFDTKAGLWSIWWLDARNPGRIDPPVRGGFKDGVGTFTGPDENNGKPVLCRYEWSKITANTAHWEQAMSPDDGKTWEVNWRMDFARA
jgi:hypothetical protein